MTADKLIALANAATPGPWFAWDRGVGYVIGLQPEPGDWSNTLPEGMRTDIGRKADADYIVACSPDQIAALAELWRAAKRVAELPVECSATGQGHPVVRMIRLTGNEFSALNAALAALSKLTEEK